MEEDRILRIKEVSALTGLSHATIYRYIAKGKFPKPVALSGNTSRQAAIGWRASDIKAWVKSRTEKERKK